MIVIYRLLAILLRIQLSSSPIAKELSKILSFDPQPYSINILKENSLIHRFRSYNNDSSIGNKSMMGISENYFSVSS
jgi:hypothetical protein